MLFHSTCLALLSATLATSSVIFGSSEDKLVGPYKFGALDDKDPLKVPGKNPLTFCADPKDYPVSIDYVDLIPNPPKPGETLTVKANGTFLERVEDGAKVHITVKYNTYIKLIDVDEDLCENLPKIDIDCPVEKGALSVEKDISIPRVVPKGKYNVNASVRSKDNKEIVCMNAEVHF